MTYWIKSQYSNNPIWDDHTGSIEYVKNFASGYGRPGGDRIVVVEFDPADVVCVPRDCDQQKIRCTQYKVVEEFKGVLSGYAERLSSDVVCTDEGSDDIYALEVIEFFDDQDDDNNDDVCPACGEDVDPDANYCGFCGERL